MNPNDITIRPARLADAEILPAIERSATLLYGEIKGFSDYSNGPVVDQVTHARWMAGGAYLVAEWGRGRRVGYLAARPTGDNGLFLHDIAVRRAFQFRGIGKALLDRALSDAANRRIEHLWIKADLQLPWVEGFCTSAGLRAAEEAEVSPEAVMLASEDPRSDDRQAGSKVWLCRKLTDEKRRPASPSGKMERQS